MSLEKNVLTSKYLRFFSPSNFSLTDFTLNYISKVPFYCHDGYN